MIKLAESSGTVAFENDGKLYISKKSGQWTVVFLFVVTLLGIISLVNAALQLFVFNYQGSLGIGIVLLILGSLMTLLFVAVRKYRNKLNAIPLNELQNVCIIDLVNNKLINSEKKVVCSLNEVVLSQKMQLSSSSPSLILKWGENTFHIVKGSPFSGGVSEIEKLLISKGIKKV